MTASPAFQPCQNVADQRLLSAAVSACLGRYRGQSRVHTESDLRVFLSWCADQFLDPLAAARADIERYVGWLQDVRLYQPSTVSPRLLLVESSRQRLAWKASTIEAGIRPRSDTS
jgi:integrase/recombinase XerD